MTAKKCVTCGLCKPLDAFSNKRSAKDGRNSQCRLCCVVRTKRWVLDNPDRVRDTHLRRTYGITLQEYNSILSAQAGVCSICRERCPTGKNLAVDHCHSSGKVRGLLCHLCNTSLGGFRDDPKLLAGAIQYLHTHAHIGPS